jgi:hypothetical protein
MRNAIQGAALVFGLLAAALGLLAAPALAVLAVAGGAPPLAMITVIVSAAAVGLGLGAPLALAAWRSQQRQASPALRLAPLWWLGLIFLGLLAVGQLALGTRLNSFILPPVHVAASLMPPLMVAAAVVSPLQRAGADLTRRHLVTQLAYGGLVATALAIALELAAALAVLVLAGAGVALLPGGPDTIQRLAADLQWAAQRGDPVGLLRSLASPGLVLGVGLLVAVVVPLLEETIKGLGAGCNRLVLGRLSRSQAFAFGVMAGVGFSFTEGLLYAAQQLPHGWAAGVALRSLTAVIHGAATGLFALGLYEVVAGRPARFFPYAAGGVGLHALWNGLSGLAALAGLSALEGGMAAQIAGGVAALFAAGLLGATWLGAVAVLVYYTQRLSAELRRGREVSRHAAG